MDAIVDTAVSQGLDEVVIGMPHRGRLNVLFNIVGKPLADLFGEFDGNYKGGQLGGSGDVKYHLGSEGHHIQMFGDGEIDITLAANPSHLEAVDPVMEGIARAKQDLLDKGQDGFSVVPVMLHGDSSFNGLGIVQETINLSQLRGYTTGGTVHIVVNNQVGFTTTPDSARSTHYATDLAKGFDCPVFHVNGDDPEAVVWVGQLATEYRRKFGKDVFIDLICYRLRGHNEADDPSMTQPELYSIIDEHKSVREIYTEELIGRGDLSDAEAEAAARDFHDQMESVFTQVKEAENGAPGEQHGITAAQELTRGLDTSITAEEIAEIAQAYANGPEGFEYHKRVARVAKERLKSSTQGGIDWGWGELIALVPWPTRASWSAWLVRIPPRHFHPASRNPDRPARWQRVQPAELPCTNQGQRRPLPGLQLRSDRVRLSMGFEYGYSVGNQDALVAWEAQFGDFANGAQTIIDEYISSGEAKWGQLSSLVLLLPHGYEVRALTTPLLALSATCSCVLKAP